MTEALKTVFRILTFRATRDQLDAQAAAILGIAIVITWLVGIGRWWDDPRVLPMFVRLGFGSVVYVFALSAVLWLIARPISNQPVSYLSFAAFVASTSLPGAVYAVPVERLIGQELASVYNLYALGFVSLYRVSLLFWFLSRIAGLSLQRAAVAVLLPISVIVFGLTALGHGARIMDIMGGFRDEMPKAAMEETVGMLGCLAVIVGPVCLLIYVAMVATDRAEQ